MKSYLNVILTSALVLLFAARPAHALDTDSELVRSAAQKVTLSLLPTRAIAPPAATLPVVFALSPAAVITPAVVAASGVAAPSQRSAVFPILASTYVALNVLDIYTTTKAIGSGQGREGNPILAPVAPTPVALTAVKIATTATTLVMAQRLWKEHRTASIVMMVAANIGTGFIVGHNASIAMR